MDDFDYIKIENLFDSELDILTLADMSEDELVDKIALTLVNRLKGCCQRGGLMVGSVLVKNYNVRPLILRILKFLGCSFNERRRMIELIIKEIDDNQYVIRDGQVINVGAWDNPNFMKGEFDGSRILT